MRGRKLLREPNGESLCAFCAHRLGNTRRASLLQRRFIQSSRANQRPPAAGEAVQQVEDDGQQAIGPSWGGGFAPSWGQPSFGNGGTPSSIPTAPSIDNTNSAIMGRPDTSKSGAGENISSQQSLPDLLPHEQRARELLMDRQRESQKRPIKIHAGAGPESTRAGRPLPRMVEARTTESSNRQGSFSIRRLNLGNRNDPTPPRITQSTIFSRIETQREAENIEKPATWSMLKKRSELNAQDRPISQDNVSTTVRDREEGSAKGYEPLGATSHLSFKRESSTQEEAISSKAAENDGWDRSMGPKPTKYRKNGVSARKSSEESDLSSQTGSKREETSRDETRKQYMKSLEVDEEDEKPRGKASKRNDAEEDEAQEAARRAELKRQRKAEKAARKAAAPTPILLPEYISVSNLAMALKVRLEDFVVKMEELGFEITNHSHILNAENAGLIAQEYNFEPIIDRGESEDLTARPAPEDPSILPQRPPVVTIMGHVDHGKTTLLDWLRKSSVAATEHGGITQHIGAFSVPMQSGKTITFLDTPGHAAFLSMRQRGANVTDIVVLVVAADDSVKPQTIEAINHAKAAKVPIIVAINKIDKEDANIERVKQDLARHGVDVEDYGGDTQVVCVSGKTGQGMEDLEETVLTLSEILDMRAETDGQAEGWVIEASIKSLGKVATVLVKRGTMRPGDFIVAGKTWARIRCLRNSAGVEIPAAGPGTPVEIDGWREQPLAGDEVLQAPDEGKAKSVVEYRLEKEERDKMAEDMEAINESRRLQQEAREREKKEVEMDAEGAQDVGKEAVSEVGGPKQIHFIIRGDVSGSVEAVVDSVTAIGNAEVRPSILRSAVGQISEWDIEHAATAKGYIINFNTPIDPNISRMAEAAKVSILDHNIIYRLVDDVKEKLSEHLPPLVTQRVLGEAEIAQIFEITVKGRQQKSIAGCKIRNGTVSKTAKVRVLRGGEKIFDGTLASLKNVKKDIMEASRGTECGMGFEDWFDFQVGDKVQSYEEVEEKRYL
ncbi:translation initiation factor IF-2 [Xylogone sp. PMI_703]|nr:translation initiation factor IF-2 [Xylogone sp. PMI_703]